MAHGATAGMLLVWGQLKQYVLCCQDKKRMAIQQKAYRTPGAHHLPKRVLLLRHTGSYVGQTWRWGRHAILCTMQTKLGTQTSSTWAISMPARKLDTMLLAHTVG